MHSSSSIRRAAIAILASTVLALVGCPKQEDFPAALNLVVPPTPTNFDITNTGGTAYSFAWTISDPTNVDHYLIYILGGGVLPDELLAETNENPWPYNPGIDLEDLQFAVSAVSTQGVEGERAVATAPGQP